MFRHYLPGLLYNLSSRTKNLPRSDISARLQGEGRESLRDSGVGRERAGGAGYGSGPRPAAARFCRVGRTGCSEPGRGTQGRATPPLPRSVRHPPGAGFAEAEQQPPPYREGRGRQPRPLCQGPTPRHGLRDGQVAVRSPHASVGLGRIPSPVLRTGRGRQRAGAGSGARRESAAPGLVSLTV